MDENSFLSRLSSMDDAMGSNDFGRQVIVQVQQCTPPSDVVYARFGGPGNEWYCLEIPTIRPVALSRTEAHIPEQVSELAFAMAQKGQVHRVMPGSLEVGACVSLNVHASKHQPETVTLTADGSNDFSDEPFSITFQWEFGKDLGLSTPAVAGDSGATLFGDEGENDAEGLCPIETPQGPHASYLSKGTPSGSGRSVCAASQVADVPILDEKLCEGNPSHNDSACSLNEKIATFKQTEETSLCYRSQNDMGVNGDTDIWGNRDTHFFLNRAVEQPDRNTEVAINADAAPVLGIAGERSDHPLLFQAGIHDAGPRASDVISPPQVAFMPADSNIAPPIGASCERTLRPSPDNLFDGESLDALVALVEVVSVPRRPGADLARRLTVHISCIPRSVHPRQEVQDIPDCDTDDSGGFLILATEPRPRRYAHILSQPSAPFVATTLPGWNGAPGVGSLAVKCTVKELFPLAQTASDSAVDSDGRTTALGSAVQSVDFSDAVDVDGACWSAFDVAFQCGADIVNTRWTCTTVRDYRDMVLSYASQAATEGSPRLQIVIARKAPDDGDAYPTTASTVGVWLSQPPRRVESPPGLSVPTPSIAYKAVAPVSRTGSGADPGCAQYGCFSIVDSFFIISLSIPEAAGPPDTDRVLVGMSLPLFRPQFRVWSAQEVNIGAGLHFEVWCRFIGEGGPAPSLQFEWPWSELDSAGEVDIPKSPSSSISCLYEMCLRVKHVDRCCHHYRSCDVPDAYRIVVTETQTNCIIGTWQVTSSSPSEDPSDGRVGREKDSLAFDFPDFINEDIRMFFNRSTITSWLREINLSVFDANGGTTEGEPSGINASTDKIDLEDSCDHVKDRIREPALCGHALVHLDLQSNFACTSSILCARSTSAVGEDGTPADAVLVHLHLEIRQRTWATDEAVFLLESAHIFSPGDSASVVDQRTTPGDCLLSLSFKHSVYTAEDVRVALEEEVGAQANRNRQQGLVALSLISPAAACDTDTSAVFSLKGGRSNTSPKLITTRSGRYTMCIALALTPPHRRWPVRGPLSASRGSVVSPCDDEEGGHTPAGVRRSSLRTGGGGGDPFEGLRRCLRHARHSILGKDVSELPSAVLQYKTSVAMKADHYVEVDITPSLLMTGQAQSSKACSQYPSEHIVVGTVRLSPHVAVSIRGSWLKVPASPPPLSALYQPSPRLWAMHGTSVARRHGHDVVQTMSSAASPGTPHSPDDIHVDQPPRRVGMCDVELQSYPLDYVDPCPDAWSDALPGIPFEIHRRERAEGAATSPYVERLTASVKGGDRAPHSSTVALLRRYFQSRWSGPSNKMVQVVFWFGDAYTTRTMVDVHLPQSITGRRSLVTSVFLDGGKREGHIPLGDSLQHYLHGVSQKRYPPAMRWYHGDLGVPSKDEMNLRRRGLCQWKSSLTEEHIYGMLPSPVPHVVAIPRSLGYTGPSALYHSLTSCEHHGIFAFGGLDGQGVQRSLAFLYKPKQKRWVTCDLVVPTFNSTSDCSVPAPRYGHTAVFHPGQGAVYVYGGLGLTMSVAISANGTSFNGGRASNSVKPVVPLGYRSLDCLSDVWRIRIDDSTATAVPTSWSKTQKDDGPQAPLARWGHSAVLYGDVMIVIGGKTAGVSRTNGRREGRSNLHENCSDSSPSVADADVCTCTDLLCLDMLSGRWSVRQTEGAGSPVPCYGHAVSVQGDHLYMFGGRTEKPARVLDDLYRLDVATRTWVSIVPNGTIRPPPVEFGSLTSITTGGHSFLVLVGGRCTDGGTVGRLHVYLCSLTTHFWRRMNCASGPLPPLLSLQVVHFPAAHSAQPQHRHRQGPPVSPRSLGHLLVVVSTARPASESRGGYTDDTCSLLLLEESSTVPHPPMTTPTPVRNALNASGRSVRRLLRVGGSVGTRSPPLPVDPLSIAPHQMGKITPEKVALCIRRLHRIGGRTTTAVLHQPAPPAASVSPLSAAQEHQLVQRLYYQEVMMRQQQQIEREIRYNAEHSLSPAKIYTPLRRSGPSPHAPRLPHARRAAKEVDAKLTSSPPHSEPHQATDAVPLPASGECANQHPHRSDSQLSAEHLHEREMGSSLHEDSSGVAYVAPPLTSTSEHPVDDEASTDETGLKGSLLSGIEAGGVTSLRIPGAPASPVKTINGETCSPCPFLCESSAVDHEPLHPPIVSESKWDQLPTIEIRAVVPSQGDGISSSPPTPYEEPHFKVATAATQQDPNDLISPTSSMDLDKETAMKTAAAGTHSATASSLESAPHSCSASHGELKAPSRASRPEATSCKSHSSAQLSADGSAVATSREIICVSAPTEETGVSTRSSPKRRIEEAGGGLHETSVAVQTMMAAGEGGMAVTPAVKVETATQSAEEVTGHTAWGIASGGVTGGSVHSESVSLSSLSTTTIKGKPVLHNGGNSPSCASTGPVSLSSEEVGSSRDLDEYALARERYKMLLATRQDTTEATENQ